MSQPRMTGDSVRSYLRDIGRIPLLEHDEEILLGRQVQRLMEIKACEELLGNPNNERLADSLGLTIKELRKEIRAGEKAKDKMVTANLRLVVSVAKKYTKRNLELLDIIQEGTIGLVRGVEKFDPGRGYKFSTYAYWWIRQGITRAIAEKSRAIRLPIHVTENLNKLKKAQRELSQMNGYMPNVFQLSDYLGLTVDEIKDLMCKARQPTSLEIKIGENRDLAYAMAKAESEVYSYRVAKENGFDAMSILPCHVIGPLLAADHNKGYSWQWCIGKMMEGSEYFKSKDGRMLWNCVDVRDTARAHRLCMQSETIANGSRYW